MFIEVCTSALPGRNQCEEATAAPRSCPQGDGGGDARGADETERRGFEEREALEEDDRGIVMMCIGREIVEALRRSVASSRTSLVSHKNRERTLQAAQGAFEVAHFSF